MFQPTLTALVLLLQVSFSPAAPPTPADLGLPPQYDLDLPVQTDTYDPLRRPPAPTPEDGEDDPRDEPPPVFFGEEIESENGTIVYVIDCSGSMRQEDRLLRAKRELAESIKGLAPTIRFNIVAYDCGLRVWSRSLELATLAAKSSARQWIGSLGADGGTATGPATALALFDKSVNAVVLLTDGAPNCGASGTEGHRLMIRSKNVQGATINVFGIAATGEYRQFCQRVAQDSGGSYFDVP